MESTQLPRTCGDCAACCKTHEIVELRKPSGAWCPHVIGHKSCGIYGVHPQSCKTFACAWLMGSGSEAERPDKVRVVANTLSIQYRGRIINWCTLMEVSEGALSRPYAIQLTEILVHKGWVVEHFNPSATKQLCYKPSYLHQSDISAMILLMETERAQGASY